MCSSRTGRRQALSPTSSQGTVGRLDDHCSSAWGRGESRHTVEPQRHQVASMRMVTRRMSRVQGQCPGFPASTVPGENGVAKLSFQNLGQEPTAGHHLLRHATPSRADLESALEDVRRSCSNSGRGHNPGAALYPAMCSEPTGFLRAMRQRGHLLSSRPVSLPALCGDRESQSRQGSQSAASPGGRKE